MQFLDIAVAAGYAALCVSLIVLMNPIAARETVVETTAQTGLDSAISSYVRGAGLVFLTTSSESAICASAGKAGNSTVEFDVAVQGMPCPSIVPPPSPLASSSLAIPLPGRPMVIEAWLARQ